MTMLTSYSPLGLLIRVQGNRIIKSQWMLRAWVEASLQYWHHGNLLHHKGPLGRAFTKLIPRCQWCRKSMARKKAISRSPRRLALPSKVAALVAGTVQLIRWSPVRRRPLLNPDLSPPMLSKAPFCINRSPNRPQLTKCRWSRRTSNRPLLKSHLPGHSLSVSCPEALVLNLLSWAWQPNPRKR